ncbi:putative SNF5 / SMARCB1 / INI1 [Lyophyllum shimeji]|uniref:SNF5 / SMARCB1 / INI1 n=1 Tax=Lyophyllum shimeji TaxID=47721 RepID=A0A9P3PND8_LYOSH|nr:putative SNF5 / SMARCB1 / INI1 [Lyophyllum shimeji]
MTENQAASGSGFPVTTGFNTMTDMQLRQTISQLSSYASPTPQSGYSKAYTKNLHTWSTTTTPPPKAPNTGNRTTRARTTRSSNLASTPQPQYVQPIYQQPMPITNLIPPMPAAPPNPPRPPLPTTPQALQSTYASRLRTGATLLMQPILTAPSATGARTSTRRGGLINYADPGSGDDLPDAGALDSDDSDFVASGGTRTSIRQSRTRGAPGTSVFHSTTGTPAPHPPAPVKAELGQSYLGMIPPAKFIKSRLMPPTQHVYPTQDMMEKHASKRSSLIPIRVEFETETHRVRDCFVWNLNETLIKPETFARTFCTDLDLPLQPWMETVANQIRAQIEDHEGVASMDLGIDGAMDIDAVPPNGEEVPECRVILSIDVQIANHHLMDHIEWDLLSPLTPEEFAGKLCTELGLGGEAVPLVAHAVHEELMKHKKDAVEWGVIGGDREVTAEEGGLERPARDRTGLGMLKDKTGLGLGWGRAPKEGRGPRPLKSVWRDWAEAEEFRTKFEVLTAEEVERREIERERASRRLRRETSKFQTTRSTRRIRY